MYVCVSMCVRAMRAYDPAKFYAYQKYQLWQHFVVLPFMDPNDYVFVYVCVCHKCVLVCVCCIFNGARALTFKSQLVVFINVIKLSDNVVYCFYGF